MKFPFNLIIVGLALLGSGCKKSDCDPVPVDCQNTNKINLRTPSVGQTNTYRMFSGTNHGLANAKITYLEDTLIIKVVAVNQNQFMLEEYFSAGSKEIKTWPGYVNYIDKVNIIGGQVDGDTFKIQELHPGIGSKLFFSRSLYLLTTQRVNNLAVKLVWFIQPKAYQTVQYGYLEKFILGNQFYEKANFCIDYELSLVDGPGYELIFEKHCSILFSTIVGPETRMGYGFELLP